VKKLSMILATVAVSHSAVAAGVDSRPYTCAGLQALIGANRFVFINNPGFGDFVVANASYCSSGEIIQRRTVPTADAAQCPVNYCKPPIEPSR
jgi:hypothetical protein